MQCIDPEIISYEHAGALQYVGIDEVREVCRGGLESSPGPIELAIPNLTVLADGDLAVAWGSTTSHSRHGVPSRCDRASTRSSGDRSKRDAKRPACPGARHRAAPPDERERPADAAARA